MTTEGPVFDWAPGVIDFLSNNLPEHGDSDGWYHKSSTAYQIGCEALAALGYATETEWGAIPITNPVLPDVLPRWDDICIAVLGLAGQQNKLTYLLADGSRQPSTSGFVVIPSTDQKHTSHPTISSTASLGPAHAEADTLAVLHALRLVDNSQWSEHAETVLWREQPRAWDLDVLTDPRFEAAVERAFGTIPDDVREEISKLVVISSNDIDVSIAQHRAAIEEMRRQYGPKARIGRLRTPEETRRSLAFQRRGELDWVFFRRWRLHEGWLTIKQADLALEIFHDPLAMQMRRVIIGRLHPDQSTFSK
jgi:hypothetical protein